MTYLELVEKVGNKAEELEERFKWMGAFRDSGALKLMNRLRSFRADLIHKYDLRPSEYHLLNDKEVGEPDEFSDIINDK